MGLIGKRRIFSAVLFFALLAGVLTGCGRAPVQGDPGSIENQQQEDGQEPVQEADRGPVQESQQTAEAPPPDPAQGAAEAAKTAPVPTTQAPGQTQAQPSVQKTEPKVSAPAKEAPANTEKNAQAPQQAPAQEPEDSAPAPQANICTLSIRCDTILKNLDALDPAKKGLIPSDGMLLAPVQVEFNEGETVFNILTRELKKRKMHLEFHNTPVYSSAYIEGINNLYEFDCGELSGWMYKVNGSFPGYGCSKYKLSPGDVVEWVYTCDLGRDVGGEGSARGGA